ncbi:MAG: hypothetical protein JWP43_2921 [Ramlibacter sp.]|nr:hypothetical protein [Ramlibacter sp.]
MKPMTWRRTAASLAVNGLLLTACGGGGGGPAPVADDGTDVPRSAMTSSAGAIAFMKSVAASSDNTASPLRVGDAVLATSDTDEPDPEI